MQAQKLSHTAWVEESADITQYIMFASRQCKPPFMVGDLCEGEVLAKCRDYGLSLFNQCAD